MSENESDAQPSKWTLCVVCLDKISKQNEYKTYYATVEGTEEQAKAMKSVIVRKGFLAEEVRWFPDQIESVTIKPTTLESEKEN